MNNVLVVEDTPYFIDLILSPLEEHAFRVSVANNAEETLKLLDEPPNGIGFNVIVLDRHLDKRPCESDVQRGDELIEEILARYPHLSIVVLTAYETVRAAARSVRKGAYYFLDKAILTSDARFSLVDVCRRAALRQKLRAQIAEMAGQSELDVIKGIPERLFTMVENSLLGHKNMKPGFKVEYFDLLPDNRLRARFNSSKEVASSLGHDFSGGRRLKRDLLRVPSAVGESSLILQQGEAHTQLVVSVLDNVKTGSSLTADVIGFLVVESLAENALEPDDEEPIIELANYLGLVFGKERYREKVEHDILEKGAFSDIIGEDPKLKAELDNARRAARASKGAPSILVLGETGTGKELVARGIHYSSQCGKGPYVEVNCAAIPETLMESELFGHEKGTFTGAHARHIGVIERASGGTLFLDEIGDMALGTQSKLLRALERREITRLNGRDPISVDFRVVAATSKDLHRLIEEGKFRKDLYFRLNVLVVKLPPLRERRADIPKLVAHFIERITRTTGLKVAPLDQKAMSKLQAHNWPGNVRELLNLINRLLILKEGALISADDVVFDFDSRDEMKGDPVANEWECLFAMKFKEAKEKFAELYMRRQSASTKEAAEASGVANSTITRNRKKVREKQQPQSTGNSPGTNS